jgi:ATP-dependent Clp protease, protease subunit
MLTTEPKETAIRFMAEVNQQSTNMLVSVLEQSLRDGVEKIRLLMSSPGGSVFHGISAYNFIKGIPIEVDTYNFGSIDSIAGVIYSAGKKRFSAPNARFLIHSVSLGVSQAASFEEKKLKELMEGLAIDRENIAKIIAANCSKTQLDIEKIMLEGVTWSPEQAKEFGLAHEITTELVPSGMTMVGIG